MISIDELTGVVSAMGALTFEEIYIISEEISQMRASNVQYDDLVQLCSQAIDEHLLEYIDAADVSYGVTESQYLIIGPNAFPYIPIELSEVIDILQLSSRTVDMEAIGEKLVKKIKYKMLLLKKEMNKSKENNDKKIEKIETKYTELLNLYSDYNSWIPGKFEKIAYQLDQISKDIETLKTV